MRIIETIYTNLLKALARNVIIVIYIYILVLSNIHRPLDSTLIIYLHQSPPKRTILSPNIDLILYKRV